jgi:hypothetical protein
MSGIEGVGSSKARWEDEVARAPDCAARKPAAAPAGTKSWAHDSAAIPDAVRQYDPALFANPNLRRQPALPRAAVAAVEATDVARTTVVASKPERLPPAADAYRGIQLACLADSLPAMSRTDREGILQVGPYTLHPSVRVHDDGSASLLYYTAFNRETQRAEFVVGPGSLETFKSASDWYANAAATTYMHGEPNAWQRASLKAVDAATRQGPLAAVHELKEAWSAAVRDPSWWGQNVLAASTALAGAGAASRAEGVAAEESAAARGAARAPGRNTPIAEGGGLRAHEGGPSRAHLIEKHVGKTSAELEARMARSPRMKGSSSFYDRAHAEAAASRALAANEAKIAEWSRGASDGRLVIDYHPRGPSFPVGIHAARDAAAAPVAGVRLVLIKDASLPSGFRILTGYPIP